jgi:cellulase/cellobiase CelA1
VLRAAPFNLDWGVSVFAKLIARNVYGDSALSSAGNGAILTTRPDPPTNLSEDYLLRTATTLGLKWTAPVFTGGAVINFYRVSMAVQGQAFSVIANNAFGTSITAFGLTAGTTYEFKVEFS